MILIITYIGGCDSIGAGAELELKGGGLWSGPLQHDGIFVRRLLVLGVLLGRNGSTQPITCGSRGEKEGGRGRERERVSVHVEGGCLTVKQFNFRPFQY